MMFTHTWAEQSTINLTTVPYEYMLAIIEFLYSQDVEHFRKQQYRETFLYNMIVFCDQFFIERLRKVCEILLLDKISIRKCGDMLEFATMYNCEFLKKGCLDFICQNLARVLLQKSLYNCEPEAIKCINAHYRDTFKNVFDYRMITPSSEAVDDECLMSFVEDFQVDLSYRMDEDEQSEYRAMNKSKAKEHKTKQTTTRQYEREAITSMMETLNISESREKEKTNEKSAAIKDAENVANKLQMEAKSWMKVVDKKEQKKKTNPVVEAAIKSNEIMKQEINASSSNGNTAFTSLNKSVELATTTTKDISPEKDLTSKVSYNINLAELTTPPREKLSQKQRKRLSSENSNLTSWRAPIAVSETKAMPVPQNAWGNVPLAQSPGGLNDIDFDVPTGSSYDPTSFANMMRSNSKTATSPSTAAAPNSFTQILAEEKRQKEYYDRVRNKSLALTQIEEQAIAELKEFYNVENVVDEIITIERKPQPTTINFAIWQRN
uniref:BTB/POZ domain protein n=1 Tax=Musca domestica TaxID=7370 RepID=T1PLP6_MUSDO